MDQQRYEKEIQKALIRLDEAWSRLSRQIAADIKEFPVSIPSGQAYLLRLLERRGRMSMTDVANTLGVRLSGCTALVDRAVEAGWVERRRDPSDRRVVWVQVSPEGERVLSELREIRAQIFARYLSCLEPNEIETLVTLLSQVAGAATLKESKSD